MSDPKSGTYVSLTDDQQHHKKELAAEDSAQQDSGFISSSSVFLSSGDLDEDEPIQKQHRDQISPSSPSSSSAASFSNQLKKNNINDKHSSNNLKEQQLLESSTYLDSGLIADQEFSDDEVEEQQQAAAKSAEMLVDTGINEWMCDRSVIDNDLNNCNELTKPALVPRPPPMEALKHMPLWQVCYTQDEDGDTQLHLSIIAKYPQAVWAIIRIAPNQCLLDIRNLDGHCAMHLAVLSSQPTIIRQLRVAGAQSSLRDRDGNSPLHLACINSDLTCVQALTNPLTVEEKQAYQYADRVPLASADLELRNYSGEYCVHIAAIRNDIDILRQLVDSGANINVREGRSGYTALHYACENGNEALTRYISSECKQLDIETCSYGLLTAYQLAAYQQNVVLMNVLQQYGAELLSPPDSDDSDDSFSEDDDEVDDSVASSLTSNAALLAISSPQPMTQCS